MYIVGVVTAVATFWFVHLSYPFTLNVKGFFLIPLDTL